ncbi:hypothetical protein [Tuwongella immobilis]|nr:hypothetical protein [Tuwongella immobilis]
MLYRWCGMLYLQIADLQLPMDRHVVELRSDNINRTLRVLADGAVVCELRYNVQPLDPPLLDDPTPFIEDEDFDFGLLLANVSQDNTRQQRMFAES